MKDLKLVNENLHARKVEVDMTVDELDNTKSMREDERKRLLLQEVKNVLRFHDEVDRRVVKDIKIKALDILREIGKIEAEISKECSSLDWMPENNKEISGREEVLWREAMARVKALKMRLQGLEDIPCLQVTTTIHTESLQMLENIRVPKFQEITLYLQK